MNRVLLTISTAILLTATAALAQSSPSMLDSIFDGKAGGGLKGFTPDSVVPVVRNTKAVPVPQLSPIRLADNVAVHTEDVIPVALEVVVPANGQEAQAMTLGMGRLAADYRFTADPNFDPVRIPLIHILPYPAPRQNQNVYLVRGIAPIAKLDAMKQAGLVRNVYTGQTSDSKGLEAILSQYTGRISAVPGVKDAYVGFDCGIKGEHYHIMAHHPAIVVELDGSQPRGDVRTEIFQAVPALAVQPLVFVESN